MKRKTVTLKVKIKQPDDVPEGLIQSYVSAALEEYCKGYFPGDEETDPDPLFNIDKHIVSIERVAR